MVPKATGQAKLRVLLPTGHGYLSGATSTHADSKTILTKRFMTEEGVLQGKAGLQKLAKLFHRQKFLRAVDVLDAGKTKEAAGAIKAYFGFLQRNNSDLYKIHPQIVSIASKAYLLDVHCFEHLEILVHTKALAKKIPTEKIHMAAPTRSSKHFALKLSCTTSQ